MEFDNEIFGNQNNKFIIEYLFIDALLFNPPNTEHDRIRSIDLKMRTTIRESDN